MTAAADTPQLVRMALSLREGIEPVWDENDIGRAVSDCLRDVDLPTARRIAALCWADPATETPGRLKIPSGAWWRLCGVKAPQRHGEPRILPNADVNRRGVEFARQQLAESAARRLRETADTEGATT